MDIRKKIKEKLEEKSKVEKIFFSIVSTAILVFSIYLSAYIDQVLSSKFKNFSKIPWIESLVGLVTNRKQLTIFIFLIMLGIIFVIVIFNSFGTEKSRTMEITPNIKIPVSAGQGQFGTARFLSESEIDKEIAYFMIDPKDPKIKKLIEGGEADIKEIQEKPKEYFDLED